MRLALKSLLAGRLSTAMPNGAQAKMDVQRELERKERLFVKRKSVHEGKDANPLLAVVTAHPAYVLFACLHILKRNSQM